MKKPIGFEKIYNKEFVVSTVNPVQRETFVATGFTGEGVLTVDGKIIAACLHNSYELVWIHPKDGWTPSVTLGDNVLCLVINWKENIITTTYLRCNNGTKITDIVSVQKFTKENISSISNFSQLICVIINKASDYIYKYGRATYNN